MIQKCKKTTGGAVLLAIAACVSISGSAYARVNTYGFNQDWLVLGPYYRDNTGANPGNASLRLDYLTDGVVTERNIIPTDGMVVNTNYTIAGSFSFVWRTIANGKDVPTVFTYSAPGNKALIDVRGGNGMNWPDCVFDQGDNYSDINFQGNVRLDHTMTYFFAYAENITGADLTVNIGIASDDSIQVLVDGIERYINNVSRGVNSNDNGVQNASAAFTLTPGKHLVCVKIFNGGGGHAFRCRFQRGTMTGNPPSGAAPAGGILENEIRWDTNPAGFAYPLPPTPSNAATAYRIVNQYLAYTAGQPVHVDVRVTTASGHPSPVVREFPPKGWAISITTTTLGSAQVLTTTTADGYTGSYIRWDVGAMNHLTTNVAFLRYTVTPPVGSTADGVCTGTVESDIRRVIGAGQAAGGTRDPMIYGPHDGPLGIFDWRGDYGAGAIFGTSYSATRPPDPLYPMHRAGDPALLGRSSFAGGVYTVTASGHDIWDNNDAGHLLAKRVSGNFILKADIKWTSMPGLNGAFGANPYRTDGTNWCKALVMVRNSLSAGACHGDSGIRNYYFVATAGADGDFITQWRPTAWGGMSSSAFRDRTQQDDFCTTPPQWLPIRLIRRGNIIQAQQMYGGVWVPHRQGWVTVTELTTAPVLACLAVTSHDNRTSVTAEFTNVVLTQGISVEYANRSVLGPHPLYPDRYTSQGIQGRIFLKHGGGAPAVVTVREVAPAGWTVASASHGGAINGTTITWTLANFSADTTLTYQLTPPSVDEIAPAIWGTGVVADQTNSFQFNVGDVNIAQAYLVTTFQQGRFPDPSYNGTEDCHIIMYRSRTGGYANGFGMNNGWYATIEEGDWGTSYWPDDQKTILLKFNTALISPAATVFSAKLMLYHQYNRRAIGAGVPGDTSGTVHKIYVAKVNKAWGEGRGITNADGTYANKGEASWYWARAAESPWAGGGLRGGALDQDMPESSADATTNTIGTWLVWDVTQMATKWVAFPSSNNGMRLSQEASNTTATIPNHWGWTPGVCNFTSRNSGTVANRPILAIKAYVPFTLGAQHWELYR